MRIKWIDRYKGFLALLVVLGHAVGWAHLEDTCKNFYVAVHTFIDTFHMPGFFLIAGYMYHTKVTDIKSLTDGVKLLVNARNVKRTVNMVVPTVVSYMFLVITLVVFANLPIKDAVINVDYWFIWVMLFVSVSYSFVLSIVRSYKVLTILMMCMTIFMENYSFWIAKIFGYYFCYMIGVCLQNSLGNSCIWKYVFKLRYALLFGYFIILYIVNILFTDTIVLNPIYKCIFGSVIAVFMLVWCYYAKTNQLLETAGKISLFIYLGQIAALYWLLYFLPVDSIAISFVSFIAIGLISFFLPIRLHKKFKDTLPYKLIFSPYQYIEPYLPKTLK